MKVLVPPAQRLQGVLEVPSDKSLTHRSIFLSALAEGKSTIENPLMAEDCLSTAKCMEALGCKIDRSNASLWKIEGVGLWGFKPPAYALDCGNSGTTMRLISGIMAAQNFSVTLTGDVSLSSRPMTRVAEPLRSMGAKIHLEKEKFAPIKIEGTPSLKPIHWNSKIASAQVKSCLLLAGLHTKGETSFTEPVLSRDHTERMLKASGVFVHQDGTRVSVQGPSKLKPQSWVVPGDISSAAFFICGALMVPNSDVVLKNINLNPTRTGLLDVLRNAGAVIQIENFGEKGGEPVGDLHINGPQKLGPLKIDETIAPRLIDEIPILAVLATQCGGVSHFSGLEELRVKETDRLRAMAENLKALGANVTEELNGLVIVGDYPLRGGSVKSFDDHRIAMAMAIAGLVSKGETEIEGSEAVSISFPQFWDMLKGLTR